MSVKVKDRHPSKNDCLGESRRLVEQILVLTRPREFDKDGKQKTKPGLLGEGQPLQAFGIDILKCGKSIHGACYQGCKIYLKDEETLNKRAELFNRAVEYCDSILLQLDLCIFTYARNNKNKRRSFEYVCRLTYHLRQTLKDRLNRDKLIYLHQYSAGAYHRRGR